MTTSTDPILDVLDKLDVYLKQVESTTDTLAEERERVQARVVAVVKEVEMRLSQALNGQPLRGCPNLLTHESPVFGYNVRKASKVAKLPFPADPEDVVEALVLLRDGTFGVIEVTATPGTGRIADRVQANRFEPSEEDYHIEDLRHILQTVVEACTKHLLQSQRTAEETKRVRELADSILNAFLTKEP